MRGLLVTLIVFAGLPFVFAEPIIGLLMWAWLSYMTPYRLAWGFAHSFPFVLITAIAALISLVISKREKWFPWTPTTRVWIIFLIWLTISMIFAIYPQWAFSKWIEVMKIQLMILVTFLLIHERRHLNWVIWIAVISIGFYGVKGGIFTILTGGHYHVWGPPGSWIADNNELGAAVLLVMPLMRYLQLQDTRRWVRWLLGAAMVLSGFTVLGTYSRGDFLGAVAMVSVLWVKSRRKLMLTVPLFVVAFAAVAFMPTKWVNRIHSTSNYKHNASALGRINAWHMAINMAEHRITGGGFESTTKYTFRLYAPEPNNVHAFHSIFFQILGDSGFIGLGLYLLLGFLTFRNCAWIIRNSRDRPDLFWAWDLAAMLQVGFAGFATSAAFLSLSYYDLPYQLMACVVLLREIVARELEKDSPELVQAPVSTPPARWAIGRGGPHPARTAAYSGKAAWQQKRLPHSSEPRPPSTAPARPGWQPGHATGSRGSR